jgi:hypothetical protein
MPGRPSAQIHLKNKPLALVFIAYSTIIFIAMSHQHQYPIDPKFTFC